MATRVREALAAGPRVWGVIGVLTLAAVVATAQAWHLEAPEGDIRIHIWVLILLFMAVESFPIHVQFRSEASSFSLFEIPLVVGVVLADASSVLVGVSVGTMAALALIRRQPLIKLIFNAANQLLQAAIIILLAHMLLGDGDPLSAGGSVVLMCAAIVGSSINVGAIAAVIGASEGRVHFRKMLTTMAFGIIVAAANASLGLIAALLMEREPWAVGLLSIPLVVVFVSYRAFVAERSQREQVEFLYTSTKSLQTPHDLERGISALLVEAKAMFRAGRVDLMLFDPEGSAQGPVRYTVHGDGGVSAVELGELGAEAAAVAEAIEEARLVEDDSDPHLRHFLDAAGVDDAMVAVLRGESRSLGLLIAGNRVGTVAAFTEEDLRLFETLCFNAAIALENDRLGQALAQLRTLERELSHQATHDMLTGLPNRSLLRRHLDRLVAEAHDVELLFIDLDDFKLVNDTLGHACGDRLLVEVAERISSCVEESDLAARLGGDEFAVVVDRPGHGAIIAESIIQAMQPTIRLDGAPVRLGCSIGIAVGAGPTTTAHLLRQADVAMYAAKSNGKNQMAHYSQDLGDDLAQQRELQSALIQALSAGAFVVEYQPVYELATHRMVGAEALVRWRSPTGLRLPGSFLSVAEESGLVVHIDRFVLGQVIEDIKTFSEIAPEGFWTAVNLSARHLQEEDVVDHIEATVVAADIDPSSIVLEITENDVMRDTDANVSKLEALNGLGFRMALDDFGTGFSSINHLRRFPISLVKIAQPFIDDLGEGGRDTFVRAIVELGHTLGLPVVAEGIEQSSQLLQLGAIGCDMGQGFLLGSPMPFADLSAELLRLHDESVNRTR